MNEKNKGLALFYKYVYIFFACCVVGFAVETLWCLLKNGYIESRKSLVYGPFSVAYGMGGVLLTAVLSKLSNKSDEKVFSQHLLSVQ